MKSFQDVYSWMMLIANLKLVKRYNSMERLDRYEGTRTVVAVIFFYNYRMGRGGGGVLVN